VVGATRSRFWPFFNGGFVAASDDKWIDVRNPANGDVLGRVSQGSATDVDAAVKAARAAFPSWSGLSGDQRARRLYALLMPVLAMGNRAVIVPSPLMPLIAADLYQVFETSDSPAGTINIVTGDRDELAKTLADHDEVAAMWYHSSKEGSTLVEKASAGNVKFTWVNNGKSMNWLDAVQVEGPEYLRRATQVKNIWVPYGE
jgi:acyl-CoA reductase-like NAD-dependent aldehyde dehydrogenase